jgi:hypothetical protein
MVLNQGTFGEGELSRSDWRSKSLSQSFSFEYVCFFPPRLYLLWCVALAWFVSILSFRTFFTFWQCLFLSERFNLTLYRGLFFFFLFLKLKWVDFLLFPFCGELRPWFWTRKILMISSFKYSHRPVCILCNLNEIHTVLHHVDMFCVEKVNLPLCLIKHHVMNMFCGSGGIAPRSLNLGA